MLIALFHIYVCEVMWVVRVFLWTYNNGTVKAIETSIEIFQSHVQTCLSITVSMLSRNNHLNEGWVCISCFHSVCMCALLATIDTNKNKVIKFRGRAYGG